MILNLGQKIRSLRLERGISTKDLALKINKAESSVKKYEGGQTSITFDILQDIATALNVTIASIILDDYDDIFELFIAQNNLHNMSKQDLMKLEIELKFILDFLSYKYDNTK